MCAGIMRQVMDLPEQDRLSSKTQENVAISKPIQGGDMR